MAQTATQQRGSGTDSTVKLFLCGDVMTGRGIDQILPHPADPVIYERYVRDARRYVELAEAVNGPIPQRVDASYIWGDALAELEHASPEVRIINLETAITTSDNYWPGKGINYRMHPANVGCLRAASVDCCTLANNHVLDWGYRGLDETLRTLSAAGIAAAGAGDNLEQARAPARLGARRGGAVLVFALGSTTAGVPRSWAAEPRRAGINLLPDMGPDAVRQLADQVSRVKRAGDIVVASLHWGGNWGYKIPAPQRAFAHRLIDDAGVDLVYGHSSHHPKGIEVYRGKAIFYGCGDFINDYEGIRGHEAFRGDLVLMYFPVLERASGRLVELVLTPLQTRRFRLWRARAPDAAWLAASLNRQGRALGTRVVPLDGSRLRLDWT